MGEYDSFDDAKAEAVQRLRCSPMSLGRTCDFADIVDHDQRRRVWHGKLDSRHPNGYAEFPE